MRGRTSRRATFPNCKASTRLWTNFWRSAGTKQGPEAPIARVTFRTRHIQKKIVTNGLKLLTVLDLLATFRLRVFSLAAVLTQEAPRTGILHGVRREANFPHKGRW